MRYGFLLAALLSLANTAASADVLVVVADSGAEIIVLDGDGEPSTSGSGDEGTDVNPCDPATFNPAECITPE